MNTRRSQGRTVAAVRRISAAIPGLNTAAVYRREWLWPDISAGLILSLMLVPVGLGYAVAAGLPPVTGLYATVMPMLAYALFGPSRILVLGPDSALAPLIAVSVLPLARGDEQHAVALAGLLAIMVGVILILAGLLRLDFITDLLSKPIRIGYLNGIALIVIISQLPALLGLDAVEGSPVERLAKIAQAVAALGVPLLAASFGIGALALIALVSLLLRRKGIGALVAVLVAIALTALLQLEDAVPVVGAMPRGFPAPALGGLEWSDVVALIGPAFAIALLAFADTGVLSRTLAARRGDRVDGNHEMFGLGIANVVGGTFGGFPISGSTSRTPVVEQAGARTQLAGVVGALLVLTFMLVVPGITAHLPEAVLAAVVISAVLSLIDVAWFLPLWRATKLDALLSVTALLGVFFVGILEGLVLVIALSLLAFVFRAWRPYRAELGWVKGLRGYHDMSRNEDAERIPGTAIVRFDAPLFFANSGSFAGFVRDTVAEASDQAKATGQPRISIVVLAAEPITSIDSTAMDELVELDDYLAAEGRQLIFAEMKGPVKDQLVRYGLEQRFPPDHFEPTVGAAVDRITGEFRTDIAEDDEPRAVTDFPEQD